jgi:hypothetical protein
MVNVARMTDFLTLAVAVNSRGIVSIWALRL